MTATSGPVPRPGILDVAPYVGGESKAAGVDRVIRLASNESALGPSPRAIAAYQALAQEIHRYPDGGSTAMREALAGHHGLDAARIVCGTGSDELIALLVRAYVGPGDEVVYSRHGFLMYELAARTERATPVGAAEQSLTADIDRFRRSPQDRSFSPIRTIRPDHSVPRRASPVRMLARRVGADHRCRLCRVVSRNDYEPGVRARRQRRTPPLRTFSKITRPVRPAGLLPAFGRRRSQHARPFT
jgi:histidinol-phosphate aminotransferase